MNHTPTNMVKAYIMSVFIQLKNSKKPQFQASQSEAVSPEIAPLTSPVGVDGSVYDRLKHAGVLNFVNRFLKSKPFRALELLLLLELKAAPFPELEAVPLSELEATLVAPPTSLFVGTFCVSWSPSYIVYAITQKSYIVNILDMARSLVAETDQGSISKRAEGNGNYSYVVFLRI